MRKYVGVMLLCVGLLAASAQAASVSLSWSYTQGADPASVFNVNRQPGCAGAFAKIVQIPVTQLTYTDSNLAPGTYCWNITALDAQGGESVPSNTVRFSVQAQPAPPSGLSGTVGP